MNTAFFRFYKFAFIVFITAQAFALFAGDHHDPQGNMIVEVLRRDYPIPLDLASHPKSPNKGAYCGPFSYWSGLHREHSSEIIIYGVKDSKIQDDILECVRSLRAKKILVTFYDDSRFRKRYDEKGNGGMTRLPTPILRREYVK